MATSKKQTSKPAARPAAAAETVEDEPETAPTRVQFPSLDGDSPAEVEHRAPGSEGTSFRSVFVMLGDFTTADHPVHGDNAGRVVEDALQRGLHPKARPQLVSAELRDEVRGKQSTVATYGVEVVPAVVDADVASTVTAGRMGG